MHKIAVSGNKGTEKAFSRALKRAGYEVVPPSANGDLLLIDFDTPYHYHGDLIASYNKRGKPTILIPHGANPNLAADGMHPVSAGVKIALVPAIGHQVVMATYDYPRDVHVVGWPFCRVRQFNGGGRGHILFAPIHPLQDNAYPEYKEVNRETYARLLATKLPLKVRFLHKLEDNGLWEAEGVEYIRGGTMDTKDIDRADVVIAFGSMLHLSAARGKPTLALAQDVPFADFVPGKGWVRAKNWVDYHGYMRFPFDVRDHESITTMMGMAAAGVEEIRRWREIFVGKQFRSKKFISIIKEVLGD